MASFVVYEIGHTSTEGGTSIATTLYNNYSIVLQLQSLADQLPVVAVGLPALAVTWPHFVNSGKWPKDCQGLQFCDQNCLTLKSCDKIAIVWSQRSQVQKVAIELPPFAV